MRVPTNRIVADLDDPRSRRQILLGATVALGVLGSSVALLSPGSGASAPSTRKVVVAKDSFARTVSRGLGRAQVGGTWSVRSGRTSYSRVSPHIGGTSVVTVAPGTRSTAVLPSVAALDVDVVNEISVPTVSGLGSGLYHTALGRVQSSGSAYGGRVTVRSGGGWAVSIMKYVGSAEQSLGSVTLPGRVVAGSALHVELSATGTSAVVLHARAWSAGSAPAWQVSRTDSAANRIARAGGVGFNDYVSAAAGRAVTLQVRAFDATATVPVAVTTPAPPTTTRSSAPSAPASSAAPTSSAPAGPSTHPSAPSSSVPPTSAPAPAPTARGSLDVGEAAYPVPAGAIFVSASSGNDSAAGTEDAPLRTVARAIALAKDGTTIVLRTGVYHESVTLNAKSGITIQAYPHEAVWFDGSVPVTNWRASGSTWVATGWTNQFDHGASFVKGSDAGGFVNPNYPMAPYPDQVLVDGVQLTQVASPSAVTSGTFAVDYSAQTITIGSDPSGHAVRSTDLARAIVDNASDRVTLRGLGVRNYGNSLPTGPAVYFGGTSGCRVENVVFADIATQALGSSRSDLAVDHVTATRIGMLSISGTQADGMAVSNSVVTQSNWEHFNRSPSAAAIKITRSRGITIINNQVTGGYDADGIWLDESVVRFSIVRNTVADNGSGANIETELSDTGVIADNEVTGSDRGVYIHNTGNVKVFNNRFAGNTRGSVFLLQDSRRESTPGPNHDPRQPIPDPTCPWIIKNITVANNVFDWNGGPYGFQFYALDGQTNIAANDMSITLEGNQFHTKAGNTDTMVAWGGADNRTLTRFESPAALKSALGKPWENTQIDSQETTLNAPASQAVPLPVDVAKALGQATGTKHLGTF